MKWSKRSARTVNRSNSKCVQFASITVWKWCICVCVCFRTSECVTCGSGSSRITVQIHIIFKTSYHIRRNKRRTKNHTLHMHKHIDALWLFVYAAHFPAKPNNMPNFQNLWTYYTESNRTQNISSIVYKYSVHIIFLFLVQSATWLITFRYVWHHILAGSYTIKVSIFTAVVTHTHTHTMTYYTCHHHHIDKQLPTNNTHTHTNTQFPINHIHTLAKYVWRRCGWHLQYEHRTVSCISIWLHYLGSLPFVIRSIRKRPIHLEVVGARALERMHFISLNLNYKECQNRDEKEALWKTWTGRMD